MHGFCRWDNFEPGLNLYNYKPRSQLKKKSRPQKTEGTQKTFARNLRGGGGWCFFVVLLCARRLQVWENSFLKSRHNYCPTAVRNQTAVPLLTNPKSCTFPCAGSEERHLKLQALTSRTNFYAQLPQAPFPNSGCVVFRTKETQQTVASRRGMASACQRGHLISAAVVEHTRLKPCAACGHMARNTLEHLRKARAQTVEVRREASQRGWLILAAVAPSRSDAQPAHT